MSIDAKKVLLDQLAIRIGLNDYDWIMKNFMELNVSQDSTFNKRFNRFYQVRCNTDWQIVYYNYFEKIKNSKSHSFDDILKYLHKKMPNRLDPSFSSKMLATIDSEKPIWDSRVLDSLGLTKAWNKNRSIDNAVIIYQKICDWYKEYKNTEEAKKNLKVFDELLPDYKHISKVKKIDYLL